jgi:uncharacterized protein YsxB (DUF464 family)
MLEVTFHRDGRGRFAALSAWGHADFAVHGEDIACAAAAAVLQTVRLGLTESARVELTAARQEPGLLELAWPERDRERESVQAIVAAAELAIEQIAQRFPKHVCLKRVTESPDRRRAHDV